MVVAAVGVVATLVDVVAAAEGMVVAVANVGDDSSSIHDDGGKQRFWGLAATAAAMVWGRKLSISAGDGGVGGRSRITRSFNMCFSTLMFRCYFNTTNLFLLFVFFQKKFNLVSSLLKGK